jgi:hypothetical protein
MYTDSAVKAALRMLDEGLSLSMVSRHRRQPLDLASMARPPTGTAKE